MRKTEVENTQKEWKEEERETISKNYWSQMPEPMSPCVPD